MAAPPVPTRLTPRTWYLVAAGLMSSALALVLISFGQYVKTVEDMQRKVMPGRAEVVLPAGASTLYAESRSVVDGKTYAPPADLQFKCALEPAAGVVFERSTRPAQYAYGDHAGTSAFDVTVPAAGTYTLVCEAAEPFVVAIGRGVGAWTVIAMVGLVPFVGGLVLIAIIFLKRRRQLRHART